MTDQPTPKTSTERSRERRARLKAQGISRKDTRLHTYIDVTFWTVILKASEQKGIPPAKVIDTLMDAVVEYPKVQSIRAAQQGNGTLMDVGISVSKTFKDNLTTQPCDCTRIPHYLSAGEVLQDLLLSHLRIENGPRESTVTRGPIDPLTEFPKFWIAIPEFQPIQIPPVCWWEEWCLLMAQERQAQPFRHEHREQAKAMVCRPKHGTTEEPDDPRVARKLAREASLLDGSRHVDHGGLMTVSRYLSEHG